MLSLKICFLLVKVCFVCDTFISKVLTPVTTTNMLWRKAGCKYSQNEIYFDMVEEIDILIHVLERVISSDASRSIHA